MSIQFPFRYSGKPLQEWYQIITASGLEKHDQMMKLLKGEYGVTHGYANTIALLYRQQAAGGAPASDDEEQIRPIARSQLLPPWSNFPFPHQSVAQLRPKP